jgi:hypothetical protein
MKISPSPIPKTIQSWTTNAWVTNSLKSPALILASFLCGFLPVEAADRPEPTNSLPRAQFAVSNDNSSCGIAKPQQQEIAATAKDSPTGDSLLREQNVLVIGASSLMSPIGLDQLVEALLESNKTPMNAEPGAFGAPDLNRKWNSSKVWDYVIMDAWQFKRGNTDAPGFPDAVATFVKEARSYNPQCKIILFPWWIPSGREATNEGVMRVFQRCVEVARQNAIWVATTGPAFMEARLARPDLRITVSHQDAHPGIHGAYINACSLFAILTGKSPVGLPATLKIPRRNEDFAIAENDAAYLQDLAWKVYQREIKNTKPAKLAE